MDCVKYTAGRLNLNKTEKGKLCEDLAVRFLKDNAFKIIKRNFRCKYGEIDIVAVKNKDIHFIEVRSSHSNMIEHPLQSINRSKIKRLKLTIAEFIRTNSINYENIHLDFIAVYKNRKKNIWELEYIPDFTV